MTYLIVFGTLITGFLIAIGVSFMASITYNPTKEKPKRGIPTPKRKREEVKAEAVEAIPDILSWQQQQYEPVFHPSRMWSAVPLGQFPYITGTHMSLMPTGVYRGPLTPVPGPHVEFQTSSPTVLVESDPHGTA